VEKPGDSTIARTLIGLTGFLGKFPKEVQDVILEDAKNPVTGFVTLESLQAAIARHIAALEERPN